MKNIKLIITLSMLYILLFSSLTSFSAATFPGRYMHGINAINYYVSPDYNWYGNSIPDDAAWRWKHDSPYIGMWRQWNTHYSKLDWYVSYNGSYAWNSGIVGHTEFWSANESRIWNADSNWYYAKIFLNCERNTVAVRGSYDKVVGTATHEVGHALGLAHNGDVNSIMSQSSIRVAQWPSYSDKQEVYRKYGY